jgi:hypothetical protein
VLLFFFVCLSMLLHRVGEKKMVETNNDADIIKVDGGSSFT